jgi:hypothetical protein
MSKDARDRGIDVVTADISYTEFLDGYLRPLKPCIVVGITEGWIAEREWTQIDPNTRTLIPNFSALKEAFGEYSGCITFCDEKDGNDDSVQREMTVGKFIDDILANSGCHFFDSSRKTYLKDFHLMRVNPSLSCPYKVPKYFQGYHQKL